MKHFDLKSLCALLLALAATANAADTAPMAPLAGDRDYALTVSRPNNMILVDLKEQKVVRNCRLNGNAAPIAIIPSSDNTIGFVITDYAQSVNAYDLETCKQVFHASFSTETTQGKSLTALAISRDDKQVYVVANQTEMQSDRYIVRDPLFMVFNTADGMNAKAVRTYKVPRQITVMSTADDGSVFISGSQIYKMDPNTGDYTVAQQVLGWNRKGFSDPDSQATYPIGQTTRELTVLYAADKYNDGVTPSDDDDWVWGMTRVDLKTGKITQADFAPYETLMFSIATNPKDSNIAYGVLTDLSMFDLKEQKLLKRVDIDHSYYSVNLSSDGSKVYLGSCLNDIAVYDAKSLAKLGNIKLPAGDMGTASFHVFHRL